jgi:hypothetical protein
MRGAPVRGERIHLQSFILSPFQGSIPSPSIPGVPLRSTPGYFLTALSGRKIKKKMALTVLEPLCPFLIAAFGFLQ